MHDLRMTAETEQCLQPQSEILCGEDYYSCISHDNLLSVIHLEALVAQKSDAVVDIDATIQNEIILSAHQTKGVESRVESSVESRIVFVNERLKAEHDDMKCRAVELA